MRLLHTLFLLTSSAVQLQARTNILPIDQNGKQCNGVDGNTQAGGMFGKSITLSSGNNGQKTWMVG